MKVYFYVDVVFICDVTKLTGFVDVDDGFGEWKISTGSEIHTRNFHLDSQFLNYFKFRSEASWVVSWSSLLCYFETDALLTYGLFYAYLLHFFQVLMSISFDFDNSSKAASNLVKLISDNSHIPSPRLPP